MKLVLDKMNLFCILRVSQDDKNVEFVKIFENKLNILKQNIEK